MTGGAARMDDRQSRAGNWTSGERRGKFFLLSNVEGGATWPLTPGKIYFQIKLTRVTKVNEEEDDEKQDLRIELSLEHACKLHEALSAAFLDMPGCEKKRAGQNCGGFLEGRWRECEACEKNEVERDALWRRFKKWDAGAQEEQGKGS